MAKRTKAQLKNTFRTGYRPTQDDFENLFDSYHHKDDSLLNHIPKYYSFLDFSGQFTLISNQWVGSQAYFGQLGANRNQDLGTDEKPNKLWYSIGIGYLPKGTVLKQLEFIGRANTSAIEHILVHLSCHGTNLNNGGYKFDENSNYEELLEPTIVPSSAETMTHMQRSIIGLNDLTLDDDRIINFACKPIGEFNDTRLWTVQARLHYELK